MTLDAWSSVWWSLPPEHQALVAGVSWVWSAELTNIYGYELPCAEAQCEAGTFSWAVDTACNTDWEYMTDAMTHEVGHIVAVWAEGDYTEARADDYARAVKGAPLCWE